jgi:hypothetical protein
VDGAGYFGGGIRIASQHPAILESLGGCGNDIFCSGNLVTDVYEQSVILVLFIVSLSSFSGDIISLRPPEGSSFLIITKCRPVYEFDQIRALFSHRSLAVSFLKCLGSV